jgi:hypothetical protein
MNEQPSSHNATRTVSLTGIQSESGAACLFLSAADLRLLGISVDDCHHIQVTLHANGTISVTE